MSIVTKNAIGPIPLGVGKPNSAKIAFCSTFLKSGT